MELWFPPDDRQRNCPKHVEFYFMNKYEKLVHLVGFSIRKISSTCSKQIIVHHQEVISVQAAYSIFYHVSICV
jgi:hypothetical protein